jgi:hypothetical protein
MGMELVMIFLAFALLGGILGWWFTGTFLARNHRDQRGRVINGDLVGGRIIVDGQDVTDASQVNGQTILTVQVKGDLQSITCDKNLIVHGNVQGSVLSRGNVSCDDVGGDVRAEGNVSCDGVRGDVDAGGSVSCDHVGGNVTAGGNISKG